MSGAMEWRIATGMLATVLPLLTREHGVLHLSYDLSRDQWVVVNDAGYAASRQRGVEALRDALAEFEEDGEVGEVVVCVACGRGNDPAAGMKEMVARRPCTLCGRSD